MRVLLKISVFLFIISSFSCEVGKVTEDNDDLLNDEMPEEFFKLLVDGYEVVIHDDPTKASAGRALAAETYIWYDQYGDKRTALKFWGTREGNRGQDMEKVGGHIKDYQGVGTYITGTDYNQNFCQYLFFGKSYLSDNYEGESGFIEITWDGDGWLTGNFDFRAYNVNDPEDSKKVVGLFKVMMEATAD